jgi:hypothetical protein
VLVVVQDYLEDALLLQGLVLVLLVLRFEGVDRAVELLLRKGLGVDGRGTEYDVVCNFQRLRDYLENLRLARADRTNECHCFLSSHVFDDTEAVVQLLLAGLKLHGLHNFVEGVLDRCCKAHLVRLPFGRKGQVGRLGVG